jgi:cytochrome c oxidase assembly protein subunit 15
MKTFRIIAILALILAWIVVMLGAYTRLTHAGLGCPDWPGCYGKMLVSNHILDPLKAWTEMIHRYLAGTLVLFILSLNLLAMRLRLQLMIRGILLFLLGLIGFQAALGMWTVTLKLLPIVVMGHLLGGLLIFGGLVYLNLRLHTKLPSQPTTFKWRCWVSLAVAIVFGQIALGGWVSANYAGLACIGFPQCNGQWLPALNWQSGFQFWSTIGTNYQGGVLDSVSRVTIQMVHRFGAMLTALYLLTLVGILLRKQIMRMKWVLWAVLFCVACQFLLGVINVIYLLPLWAAVAHNGVAALLFASVLSLHFMVYNSGVTHDHAA